MYQVLDLYSSLPREPKRKPGFKKAGTPSAGRGRYHRNNVRKETMSV